MTLTEGPMAVFSCFEKLCVRSKNYKRSSKTSAGAISEHLVSVFVHETFQETEWSGMVEVFLLSYNLPAKRAYAWSCETDDGQTRYEAVVGIPPINSAYDAVRAYVKRHAQKQK